MKKLTILIVRTSNFYLHNLSCSCYQLLTPGNFQSALTEEDRRRLPVASYQSKWLISLGIARWQTVVLLLSTQCIIINAHGESVLLVSSLSVLIVLLVVATIFTAVHTDGRSKASFDF